MASIRGGGENMTESEAVKEFQQNIDLPFGSNVSKEAAKMAIQALEEVQKYREIGSIGLYSIMVMPSMRKKNNQK